MKTKYSKQELEDAIVKTGVSTSQQKSLRRIIRYRRGTMVVGYMVFALGFLCLIPFFSLYLEYSEDRSVSDLRGMAGVYFWISIVLASIGDGLLNRAHASLAVSALLMKKTVNAHPIMNESD
jgi:hypothetical protein